MKFSFQRLSTRLGALIGGLLLLLAASALVSLYELKATQARFSSVYEARVVPMRQLQAVSDGYFLGMVDTAHKVRDGSMTIEAGIEAVTAAQPVIAKEWAAYTQTRLTPEEQAMAQELTARMKRVEAVPGQLLGLLRAQDKSALAAWAAKDMYPALDPIADSVTRLIEFQRRVAGEEFGASQAAFQRSLALPIGVAITAIVFGLVMGRHEVRRLLKLLGGEPQYATQIVRAMAQGDLSVDVRVRPGDNTSLLAAMRDMRDGLARVVGEVRQSSNSVASGSTQIAAGNADLSERTELQATNLQQTAEAMERISSALKATAENTQAATDLAGTARESATRGGALVSALAQSMQDIADSSQRMADIVGTIDGIAFQTNILALNAAVEAARAGDQGRGFAVVATEVRSLAGRSAAAAREIKQLIGSNVEKTGVGSAQAGTAAQAMAEILAQVGRVSDLIAETGAAASEQTGTIGQISGSVGELDSATQQNAALVEQSAAAAASLQQQAQRLVAAVGQFRLAHSSGDYSAVESAAVH